MTLATSTIIAPSVLDSTSARMSRYFYAPELDLLRFVAFLLVFCRHVFVALGTVKRNLDTHLSSNLLAGQLLQSPVKHAWSIQPQEVVQALDFGVCLFFFLSAFLITRLLLMERHATGRVHVRRFYVRRVLRIWPLYFFFLALVVVLSHYFPVLDVTRPRLLAALLFVGNWAAVLHGWNSIAIQPLWSVSVEEQFYLVWPVFARHGRRAVVLASCIFVLASVSTLIYFGLRPGTEVAATWPNTLVQGLFLAGGALTACYSFPENRQSSSASRLLLLGAGAVCWLMASAGCHIVRTNSPGALALVAGYGLVLAGTISIFFAVAGWKTRTIPAWLLYLGRISYGLYVFHVACLLLMEQATSGLLKHFHLGAMSPYLVVACSAVLALLLTLTCASLTYRLLERPFLKLKDRFSGIQGHPI